MLIFALVIGAVVLLLVAYMILLLNLSHTLKKLAAPVEPEWHKVSALIRERDNLIPGFTHMIHSYGSHDDPVPGATEQLRDRSFHTADTSPLVAAAAESELDTNLQQTLEYVGRYPELIGSLQFQQLYRAIVAQTNDVLAAARRYNETAQKFNDKRRTFLGRYFAAKFGFPADKELFVAPAAPPSAASVQAPRQFTPSTPSSDLTK